MATAQNPLTPEDVSLSNASSNLETPKRVLAIGAHPDDIDFGCGATLAKWANAGSHIDFLVCTDGSKGTWDSSVDRAELVLTRKREQRASAAALGATGDVVFLGHSDGELEANLAVRSEVTRWIRKLRPAVVLGHDPWRRYRLHPDHRAAGWLVTDSVVAARDATFFPDHGLPHHRPELILLWEADQADHFEDVSGFAETKFEALLAHKSQHVSTMSKTGAASSSKLRLDLQRKLQIAGKAAGVKEAEVFKLIDDL